MSREVLLLVDALAREKNVDKDVVFGALEFVGIGEPCGALKFRGRGWGGCCRCWWLWRGLEFFGLTLGFLCLLFGRLCDKP